MEARSAASMIWLDRQKFNELRKSARESMSLALECLSVAGGTDDVDHALDAMSDAMAHLDAAKASIDLAFHQTGDDPDV